MSDSIILNIYEIKAKFSYYAKQVLKGQSFIIAYRNKPFAKFVPIPSEAVQSKIKFGLIKKKFKIPEDFNSPLLDFEKDYYGA